MGDTIALIASKGGVGKSTLAAALAVHAARTGSVGLQDWDAQGSLSLWWRLRGSPDNPLLLPANPPGRSAKRTDLDVVIIDTGPGNLNVIERAVRVSDALVIPVRAGIFDFAAVRDAANICLEHKKPFGFVLNCDEPRRHDIRSSTMSALTKLGPLLGIPVEDRVVYVSALPTGKSGPEAPLEKRSRSAHRLDTEGAAEEIAALWTAVQGLLRKGKKK